MLEMMTTVLRSRVGRAGAVIGLTAMMSGCASWQLQDGSPADIMRGQGVERARVTTNDGAQVVLRRPRVRGSVLQGWDDECWASFGTDAPQCEPIGFAVFEVASIEFEEQGNVALILPGIGLLGALILLVFAL